MTQEKDGGGGSAEGREPGRLGGGRRERKGREAGEERAGSGSSKRAGSGREMRNANYFNLTMR